MADTAVTVQTVIDNSIARAKDADKTQWSDAMMLIFINKAVDYIHKLLVNLKSEIAITDTTITMVASTQEYNLSGNLDDFWGIAVNGVYFTSIKKPLIPIPYEDKIREGTDTTNDDPKYFYITSTVFGVVNVPTTTSVAAYATLNCRYFKKNTALVLGDDMPYKNVFNEPIGGFVDHLAMMKADDPTQEVTELFNTIEQSVVQVVQNRINL